MLATSIPLTQPLTSPLSIQEKNNVIKQIKNFLADSESGMVYDYKKHCN
jgi:hypothetical protein